MDYLTLSQRAAQVSADLVKLDMLSGEEQDALGFRLLADIQEIFRELTRKSNADRKKAAAREARPSMVKPV